MSKRTLLSLVLSTCCALALACDGGGDTRNANRPNTPNVSNPGGAAATNAAPANVAPTPAATASTGGIAECDEYIKKAEDCINNPDMPSASAKSHLRTGVAEFRKYRQTLAEKPETRDELTYKCKNALDSARATYNDYLKGCKF